MKRLFAWYTDTPLIWLNIGAFVLGCAAGLVLWKIGAAGYKGVADHIISILAPFGNILISMLKMIVIPIIFCSLVCGSATLPVSQFGKMGRTGRDRLVYRDFHVCRGFRLFHRHCLQSPARQCRGGRGFDADSGAIHADHCVHGRIAPDEDPLRLVHESVSGPG